LYLSGNAVQIGPREGAVQVSQAGGDARIIKRSTGERTPTKKRKGEIVMANIDTSTIEGFDALTPEQKVEALLKLDIPDKVDLTQYVPKATADKYSSEAAALKKQLQGKMTEEEAAAAERAAELNGLKEQMAALQADNEKLQKERTESIYKAKYLAMPGFDEKLAEETAKAMAAGDMDKVFVNQQKANEEHEKQIKAELVKGDPKPGGAGGTGDGEPDNVKFARDRAKQRAAAMSAGSENLKKFLL